MEKGSQKRVDRKLTLLVPLIVVLALSCLPLVSCQAQPEEITPVGTTITVQTVEGAEVTGVTIGIAPWYGVDRLYAELTVKNVSSVVKRFKVNAVMEDNYRAAAPVLRKKNLDPGAEGKVMVPVLLETFPKTVVITITEGDTL